MVNNLRQVVVQVPITGLRTTAEGNLPGTEGNRLKRIRRMQGVTDVLSEALVD